MKKIRSVLSMVIAAAMVLSLPACKSPNRSAFVVEGIVVNSVESATTAFLELVVNGKVTIETEVAYRAKYNRYLAAQAIVRDLVESSQPGTTLDRTTLDAALAAVSSSSADVIAFVQGFGKLTTTAPLNVR